MYKQCLQNRVQAKLYREYRESINIKTIKHPSGYGKQYTLSDMDNQPNWLILVNRRSDGN